MVAKRINKEIENDIEMKQKTKVVKRTKGVIRAIEQKYKIW